MQENSQCCGYKLILLIVFFFTDISWARHSIKFIRNPHTILLGILPTVSPEIHVFFFNFSEKCITIFSIDPAWYSNVALKFKEFFSSQSSNTSPEKKPRFHGNSSELYILKKRKTNNILTCHSMKCSQNLTKLVVPPNPKVALNPNANDKNQVKRWITLLPCYIVSEICLARGNGKLVPGH